MSLTYRFVMALDLEGFSRLSTSQQISIQKDLKDALSLAARRTGLDRADWHCQVAGDGELAILPGDTDGATLVAHYPGNLRKALAIVNARRRGAVPIRVRLAIHHGTMAFGVFGPAGDAPVTVSRLLDARILRRALRTEPTNLALIISSTIFTDIVKTGFNGLDPDAFEQVRFLVKGITYLGYLERRAH